jgi:hypothetical protein
VKTRRDLMVQTQAVTLTLPWRAAEIHLFRPTSAIEPVKRLANVTGVKLEIPDEVLLVEIRQSSVAENP